MHGRQGDQVAGDGRQDKPTSRTPWLLGTPQAQLLPAGYPKHLGRVARAAAIMHSRDGIKGWHSRKNVQWSGC